MEPHDAAPAEQPPRTGRGDQSGLAGSRRAALRRRVLRIRRSVAGLAAALFSAAFLAVYVQLASGHDPALSSKTSATAASTSTAGASVTQTTAAKQTAAKAATGSATTSSSPTTGSETSTSASSAGKESSSTESSAAASKESSQGSAPVTTSQS